MLKNIIFSGGGFKGWAYIGTIRALYELIDYREIEQVIGVSIGSLFGLCYVLHIEWEFLLDCIINLNFFDILDIDIDNLFIKESIICGLKFTELIKSIISAKIDPDITFIELYKYSKILFTVNALNISDSRLEYFNYINTPNIKVLDSLIASSALPPLFPPFKIQDKWYYDGGFCNNCPINLVDEQSSIAFDLSINEEFNSEFKLSDLLVSLVNIINKISYNKESTIIHKLLDSRFKNELFNYKQSRDDRFTIYMNGYINSKRILFDNYIALPSI